MNNYFNIDATSMYSTAAGMVSLAYSATASATALMTKSVSSVCGGLASLVFGKEAHIEKGAAFTAQSVPCKGLASVVSKAKKIASIALSTATVVGYFVVYDRLGNKGEKAPESPKAQVSASPRRIYKEGKIHRIKEKIAPEAATSMDAIIKRLKLAFSAITFTSLLPFFLIPAGIVLLPVAPPLAIALLAIGGTITVANLAGAGTLACISYQMKKMLHPS